jgi:hypothetical protein
MRVFTLSFVLLALLPLSAVAQWADFPPDLCCDSLKPVTKMLGSVRTVLEVERNISMTFETTVTTYDEKGRKVEKLRHSAGNPPEAPPGKLIRGDSKYIYSYDAAGKLTQKDAYDEAGTHYAKQSYLYDAEGRLAEEISQVRGRLFSKTVYRHEPDRQRITAIITEYHGEKRPPNIRRREFIFDVNERSVQITTFTGSRIDWTMLYKLDEEGRLIRQTGKRLIPEDTMYTYKLDRHGNWIEREERKAQERPQLSAEAKAVTFRMITYYDEK